jgi:RNA polymerase sigma-70 factor, ECF subfamily
VDDGYLGHRGLVVAETPAGLTVLPCSLRLGGGFASEGRRPRSPTGLWRGLWRLRPGATRFRELQQPIGQESNMPADSVHLDDRKDYLGRLVESHFDSVFAFFARRVGTDLAPDLTAESFKEAIASISRFDPNKGSEIAWLFAIAHHVLSHHRRTERRRLGAYATFAAERDSAVKSSDNGDDGLDQAIVDRVARTLRRLPNEQRDAFILVAVDGVSYADAALILGVPLGTVRSRVSRARSRLRRSAGLADAQPLGKAATIRGGD